ncbi:4252_t:CDS:2, partial [Acaulospora morrowiae]
GTPIVLGNTCELGDWKLPVVQLNQVSREKTYWKSEPVSIKIKSEAVKYRYAIYIRRTDTDKLVEEVNEIFTEGGPDFESRVLKHSFENQYDIVDEFRINHLRFATGIIEDYAFVHIIYRNLTIDNINEKIHEYLAVLNRFPNLTINSVNFQFIEDNLMLIQNPRDHKEKILFLIILLTTFIYAHSSDESSKLLLPNSYHNISLLEYKTLLQFLSSQVLPYLYETHSIQQYNKVTQWLIRLSDDNILNFPNDSPRNIQENVSTKSEGGKSRFVKLPSLFSRKNEDSFQTCKVTFHVHLPPNIEHHGQPVVIGSCKELGRWDQVVVMLERPDRSRFPTYWRSETVDI